MKHKLQFPPLHGFPDSVYRFHKIIPMLTEPAAHKADPADAFDVVAPSLPGYAFSSRPRREGAFFASAISCTSS